MKVAVFGPGGMLGKQVVRSVETAGHEAFPIHRRMVELLNQNDLRRLLVEAGVTGVINCAGVIPVKNTSVTEMIYVNSMFPHVLVDAVPELPIVLVSTDCVFSGKNKYRYTVYNVPNPIDYYGKSKALGEKIASNAAVVRTSFIGCEHGLMNTVINAGNLAKSTNLQVTINGWKNALWTGSTVDAVADALVEILFDETKRGIIHLSTEKTTTKYDLICKIIEHYGFNVFVNPEYTPDINRALTPTIPLKAIDQALTDYKCLSVLPEPVSTMVAV